jgi:hypothetical protein
MGGKLIIVCFLRAGEPAMMKRKAQHQSQTFLHQQLMMLQFNCLQFTTLLHFKFGNQVF